ncbi:Symplekin tight junction protein C terminal-domain-containing protein [Kickxella alabastrina]|uniref:Symplekin tight junction protein C terminal-domain-containing protein n=1 Tax=Kickxella alabastrina TaxID=61397 RepID=UPI0022211A6B|nr:Symplekin tight junction protein C terminal-domain-containing protein [Kickxella alabastrina]KAI7835156.1 Symplekin tight junction protein C terminal-domain-containing protein [Kickxella alabastrina]
MATHAGTGTLEHAQELYVKAVHEVPPNRNMLDDLVDYLRDNPALLYGKMFETSYDAANTVVDVCHGNNNGHDDENLAILTPPAAWGWAVMEEAVCRSPPSPQFWAEYNGMVQKCIDLATGTLRHMDSTPGQIVRRAIQTMTRLWPVLIGSCIAKNLDSSAWRRPFETMLPLAIRIFQLSEHSDDPALQVHLVKFLEVEATIFAPLPYPDAVDKGGISLETLPELHPFIEQAVLAKRGEAARYQLMRLLPNSDNLQLCNIAFITGIISSIIYLMNLRPQFCAQLLEKLTEWYAIIHSSEQVMTQLQLAIVCKTLSLNLLNLYTRRYMGEYSELLENTMDIIGGQDWASWQERQARDRERKERQRIRERSMMPNRHQQQYDRWIPTRDANMADQSGVPPPPLLPGNHDARMEVLSRSQHASAPSSSQRQGDYSGQKRSNRQEDDEDEEYQRRMLEENTKRVKLEEVKEAASSTSKSLTGLGQNGPAAQRVADSEKEMEEEMRAALHTGTFELQPTLQLAASERSTLIVDTMKRVVAGSKAVEKFISLNRMQASSSHSQLPDAQLARGKTTESSAQVTLPNGLSTNAGVLEDSMLLLVRMVANCYIMSFEAACVEGAAEDMGPDSKWAEMHTCMEGILQSITESPRSQYNLAILLLYEMWLAVVSTDPELKQDSQGPGFEFTMHALYLRWCEQIFDAVVKCSIETTLTKQVPVQVVPDVAASVGEPTLTAGSASHAAGPAPATQMQDRLILDFILDAPELPPRYLEKLSACFQASATATLGFSTLEKAIEMRPPVFKTGIKMLLTYCASHSRGTRIGCIRAVKKHYPASPESALIENIARGSLKRGVENADRKRTEVAERIREIVSADTTDPEEITKRCAELDVLKKKGEQEIDAEMAANSELLLALCTRNMDLLLAVFEAYTSAHAQIKMSINRLITPLIKSVSNTPGKVVPILSQFPAGAEVMAVRVIRILTRESGHVPSRDLIQGVLDMHTARNLDPRFIVAICNGLTKAEAISHLGSVVGVLDGQDQPRALVGDFFVQLTKSYPGRPSVLSPTELLIALHNNLGDNATDKQAMEAIALYEGIPTADGTPLFHSSVFTAAFNQLVAQEHVPPLMLYTAELFNQKRKGNVGPIINILAKLIEKKVWTMGDTMVQAFSRCLHCFEPGTLSLIKTIPSEPLKKIIGAEPRLQPIIRDYVKKMSHKDRAPYKWLLSSKH